MKKTKKSILEETLSKMPEVSSWGVLYGKSITYEVNFDKAPTNYFLSLKEFSKSLKMGVGDHSLAIYNAIYMELEKEREASEGFIDKLVDRIENRNKKQNGRIVSKKNKKM